MTSIAAQDPRTATESGAALRWLAWPEQWIRYRIGLARKRRLISGSAAQGLEPVFVFCHPRVSSKSLTLAVDATPGLRAVHLHSITKEHARWRYGQSIVAGDGVTCWGESLALAAREYLARAPHARFVTAIRDPIAVNVSLFLFWGRKHFVRRQWGTMLSLPTRQLADLFLDRCPHMSSVNWFEREFLPALGAEDRPLEQIGFDSDRGFGSLRTARASALILRADTPDAAKQAELSRFLGCAVAAVERTNESAVLFSKELHQRLTEVVARIPGYTDELLSTRYARAFWNDSQRAELREKWARLADGG